MDEMVRLGPTTVERIEGTDQTGKCERIGPDGNPSPSRTGCTIRDAEEGIRTPDTVARSLLPTSARPGADAQR